MRRVGTALLALVMALSCFSPALAVEETTDYEALQVQIDALYDQIDGLYEQVFQLEDQMAARYADYYEIYGDMAAWDDDTWALSDNWSDTEWDGYWAGEEAASEGYDYLAEAKAELGMHFPEGINVRVNGAYLDAAPTAIDGVTYLSADALLAALDLEGTAVAPVDLNGVSYLPIRAVAEEAGYDVAWDGYYEVVELDNWDTVAAAIDEEFTILNTILAASMNTVDPAKTYATKGTVDYTATLYGEEKHDTASITMDVEGLVKGDYSAMSLDYGIRTDLTDLEEVIAQLGGQEALDAVNALNGELSLRMDGAAGGVYVKSDLWSAMDAPLPDGKWIGMEDAGFGAAYTEMMAGIREMTVGSLLVMIAKDAWAPYETLDGAVAAMKLLAGDDLFTTSKSGSVTTYTCKMDMVKLVTRAAALGLFTADDIGSLFGDTGLPTADYTITAKVSGDKLTAMTAKGNLSWSILSLEFDMDSTQTRGESWLALKSRYLGKIEMTSSTTTTVTTQAVPGVPADCLDYEALMEDYYSSLYGDYEW